MRKRIHNVIPDLIGDRFLFLFKINTDSRLRGNDKKEYMTPEDMLATILKTSFVKADMLRRIRIVRQFTEQRFFASVGPAGSGTGRKSLEDYLSTDGISEDDRKIIGDYGQEFYRSFTKDNAYDLLEALEAGVKKLDTINFYVPVELDGEGTKKLGDWVRQNVDKSLLIELHVDGSVLGGCAFARNGTYRDFSLHHAMVNHGREIHGILDSYIKKLGN